jgi:signal transduction histidine kinase
LVNRTKLFLTFLVVCLLPLLLLALVNYWIVARSAGNKLTIDHQRELADFKSEVSRLLDQDQNELLKLGQSQAVQHYLSPGSESVSPGAAAGLARTADHSINTGSAGNSAHANVSSVIPVDVRLKLASILNGRSHFSGISLFDSDGKQLFFAEQVANGSEAVAIHTQDFLSEVAQPDDRVWTASAMTVLNSPPSRTPVGARIVSSVPVFGEKQNMDRPQGALAGELQLDRVFSEATKGNKKTSAGSAATGNSIVPLFVVIDRSGTILYHSSEALKYRSVGESMPYFLPVAHQMFASEDGSHNYTSASGETYSATSTRIPALDVAVAVASNRNEVLADVRRTGLIILGLALLLGTVAAFLLTRYWQLKSSAIERVTRGVEAIAQGKLDHRIELLSSDNLRPLADNVGLVTQQLREQLAREAETRQFQSFVRLSAILTHDLKNAIEALSLTVTNMERHFDDQEFRADAMKTLRSATEKLRALVTRLSTPVTTLSGEHKLPRPVDLVPMIKRVAAVIAKPAQSEHEIQIKLPESLFALVDIDRMDKVIENLIINALESMGAKSGTLTIEGGMTDDDKPFFSVTDTGEGMSQQFIEEKLFHPFATTKKRGVGLGLYTCREVVRANGGTIEVDSKKNAGTTFRVMLPSAELEKRSKRNSLSQPVSLT